MKRWLLIGLLLGLSGLTLAPSVSMQGFVTNTPSVPLQPSATQTPLPLPTSSINLFITATPIGFVPSATPFPAIASTAPSGAVDLYALPVWFEQDLLDLLFRQIEQLPFGGADAALAVQLTTYELTKRFPNAPSNSADLERIIQGLLNAPIGSVDMRQFVRRYIGASITAQPDVTSLVYNGFQIEITPAKLNSDAIADAVIQVSYPATTTENPTSELRYQDTIIATRDELGRYLFLPSTYNIPAFPFIGVNSVEVAGIDDFNQDTLDEVLFIVDDGQVNLRYVIVGVRNETAVELVSPDQEIRVGEVENWVYQNTEKSILSVQQYEALSTSPDWACNTQILVNWEYSSNLFRPSTAINVRPTQQNSLACFLFDAEPLLLNTPADSIATVEQALQSFPFDSPGVDRAVLTLALLYAMDNRLENARSSAESVLGIYGADGWAGQQANAFINGLNDLNYSLFGLCVALVNASPDSVCRINDFVMRLFSQIQLSTAQDLRTQLEQYGFRVLSIESVGSVGRATREVVQLDINGLAPIAFLAGRDGFYTVEMTETTPLGNGRPPQGDNILGVINSLLVRDDPALAITLVDSIEASVGADQLSPAAQYMRALAYDLIGRRADARNAYYHLWRDYGTTIWGQLSGEHLEYRG
jgi:hypothetical protein